MPNNRDENKNGKVSSRIESSPRRGKHKKKRRTQRRRQSRGEVDAGKGPLVEYSDVSSQDLSGPEAGDSISLSEGEVNSPPPAAKKNFDTTETPAPRPRSPPPEAPPARHRSPEMPRRRSPIEPPRHRSPVESHSRYCFKKKKILANVLIFCLVRNSRPSPPRSRHRDRSPPHKRPPSPGKYSKHSSPSRRGSPAAPTLPPSPMQLLRSAIRNQRRSSSPEYRKSREERRREKKRHKKERKQTHSRSPSRRKKRRRYSRGPDSPDTIPRHGKAGGSQWPEGPMSPPDNLPHSPPPR
jgi:hypothetical protein